MRRLSAALTVLAAGCISRVEAAPRQNAATIAPPRAAQATGSSITGRVTWHGAHPAAPAMPHTGPGAAGCGESNPFQALRVGSDEGVQFAVVSLEGPSVPAASGTPVGTTLDQHGCMFEPHVVALQAGGRLTLQNHDTVLHSAHAFRGGASEFNVATPPGLTMNQTVRNAGLLRLQCDVGHNWMHGFIHAFPHAFFAVTDAHGAFHIDHVPAGTYTVRMWHEGWTPRTSSDGHPSYSDPVTQTHSVTVTAGAPAQTNFTLGS